MLAVVAAGGAHLWALDVIGATAHAWYYAPALACSAFALSLTVTSRATVAAAGLLVVTGLAVSVQAAGPVPWRTVPLQGNTASAEHYAAVGEGLRAVLPPRAEVETNGEVGAVAYFCRCAYVDHLSDRALVQPYLDAQLGNAGPLSRRVWEVNYAHREPSGPAPRPGFVLRTVAAGTPHGPGVAEWTTDGPVPRTSVLYAR